MKLHLQRKFGIAALAGVMAGLGTGCESMGDLAKLGTEIGTTVMVATGDMTTNQATSVNNFAGSVADLTKQITPEQEYYIGRTVAATVLSQHKPLAGVDDLNTYLNTVGQALAQFSLRPETFGGYHFLALDSDEINAFAAPGGLILVTRGLLACCQTEDELAAVLAHEIGHVEKLHGIRAIKTGRLSAAMLNALSVAGNYSGQQLAELTQAFDASISDITQTLMNSGYSRKLEYEADTAAVAILKGAGYETGALAAMLENMAQKWDASRKDFAATHPPPADRIAQLKKIGVTPSKASNNARQQRFLAATR
jgi:predicted Zn-dependent protease